MTKSWTLEQVAEHWDKSPEYDKQNAEIDSYFRRFTDSAPLFSIPENGQVLDVDCRTGKGTLFFSKRYPTAQFYLIAMARSFKARADQTLTQAKIKAPISVMREKKLMYDEGTFDVVLSYETLEHVPWPHDFIGELSRVLKPGGTLVLTTPNPLWEPVHWLSATLHIDHGEGPHRMVPRKEILKAFAAANLHITTERAFVLIPAGPKWLLQFGYWLERTLPEWFLRSWALRRTFICTKFSVSYKGSLPGSSLFKVR